MKIIFKILQPNNEKKVWKCWEGIGKSIIKYELQGDDPANQLQGLLAAYDNLKRIGEAFKAKLNLENV